MGLDYKLDLHSMGTGGQWWDVGDVIRFGLGSLFVLHLGKRETQWLRGPRDVSGAINLPFFFLNLGEDYVSVFILIIHLVVYL